MTNNIAVYPEIYNYNQAMNNSGPIQGDLPMN
jgi:hypothetical protein